MPTEQINVLIVEDNKADARLCVEALRESVLVKIDAQVAPDLASGLEAFGKEAYESVILDLGLPDSQGLETLIQFRSNSGAVPIIVTTGQDDDALGIEAVRAGASDFIPKSEITGAFLSRAVRYAVERERLRLALERATILQEEEREMESLARLSGPVPASVTASTFGLKPIGEAAPEHIERLTAKYQAVVNAALEKELMKDAPEITTELRQIARELAFLNAGPRDVVDLHVKTLKAMIDASTSARTKPLLETGRMVVVELMGYLVDFYRNLGGIRAKVG